HAALFCFRLQPTWRLGRGVQSVVIFHAKRRPQGHLQCLQNISFVKGGGETTITPKHLSILHAITLQECRVFERYGVKITFMNLNQATAAWLTLALHLLILKVNSSRPCLSI